MDTKINGGNNWQFFSPQSEKYFLSLNLECCLRQIVFIVEQYGVKKIITSTLTSITIFPKLFFGSKLDKNGVMLDKNGRGGEELWVEPIVSAKF